jgi:hypothetical protein
MNPGKIGHAARRWFVGGASAVIGFSGAPTSTDAQSASPAPAITTYPTIGHARSQRYCAIETDRINGAITVALTNDKVISIGIERLRAADLDKPEITIIEREKSMHDLRAVAAAIQTNLRAGCAETTDLRALSVREPDANRSAELKVLADRLDEALGVQHSIGSDLAKMLTIVEGRYAGAQGALAAAGVMPEQQQDHVKNGLPSIDDRAAHEPLNALFADVANDFSGRVIEIGKAEDAAASDTPKAVAGC